MAKILLVEQHANRSFDSLIVISEYLKQMGHEVHLSLSGNPLKEKIMAIRPDMIYMPWAAPRFVEYLKNIGANPLLLNSYQEQNQLLDAKRSPYVDQIKDTDYFFCWGDIYGKKAKEINPAVKYYTAGVTRYDSYLNKDISSIFTQTKAQLAKKYGIPEQSKWVLVAYDYALLFKPKRIERALKMGLKTPAYIEQSWKAFHRLSEWLRKVANDNPDYSFILRPHPGSPLNKLQEVQQLGDCKNIFYNSEGPISQWILNADKYLTRLSSSILEAWIANKDAASLFPDLRTPAIEGYLHIKECDEHIATVEDLQTFLRRENRTDHLDRHRAFLEGTFGQLDGQACLRTAQGINEIAAIEKANFGPQNYSKMDQVQLLKYRGQNGFRKLLLETGLIKWTPWRNKPLEYVSDNYIREKSTQAATKLSLDAASSGDHRSSQMIMVK